MAFNKEIYDIEKISQGQYAQAIGISNEVAENDRGSLNRGRSLKVTAGDSESSVVHVTGDQEAACRSPWAKVELVIPAFGKPDLILPAFLKKVEVGAFEGIAATVVEVPANCVFIGKHALRNCPYLTRIRIPAGCFLGEDVFDGSKLVFVYGTVGSSTESYCNEATHGNCVFIPVE